MLLLATIYFDRHVGPNLSSFKQKLKISCFEVYSLGHLSNLLLVLRTSGSILIVFQRHELEEIQDVTCHMSCDVIIVSDGIAPFSFA